ncbi:MAG: hypothetical protein ONA90_07840 [candidate division KSB1 bacterium]|nr:hypothetical protein [candidate division KSB1 bacterium]
MALTTNRSELLRAARKRRNFALALTALLLLLSYVVLRLAALPRSNFIDRHYDEINWTRFLPKPKPVHISEVNETAPEKAQPVRAAAEIAEVPRLPQRMDLSAELKDLEIALTKSAPAKVTARGAEGKSSPIVTREAMPSLLESELEVALNFDMTNMNTQLPRHGRRTGNASKNEIKVGSDGVAKMGGGLGQSAAAGDAGLGMPGRDNANRGRGGKAAVQVELKGLGNFGDNYRNFSPIYRALLEWMRRHPVDLPEVVDRFMSFEPGNLTSQVTFSIDNRRFDMFLLCVEATYEVRICLVEGNEVTYLIDQGFKKQSNYLRLGALAWLPTGEIHRFGSVLREASDQRTQDFYQIFLSWWETVKHEVE